MSKEVLTTNNIQLNKTFGSKEEAIRQTGAILVENGYVNPTYIEKMLEREELTSTFMGNSVAIPHGTDDAKKEINETGISIITVPHGVDFGGGNIVKVLIGIAGKGDDHLEVLSKIAIFCSEEENIEKVVAADTAQEVYDLFNEAE